MISYTVIFQNYHLLNNDSFNDLRHIDVLVNSELARSCFEYVFYCLIYEKIFYF